MTVNREPTADELNGVKQDTVHFPAKALRVTQTDSDGNEITSTNPLPITSVANVHTDLEGLGDITIGTSEVEIAITGTPTEQIRIQADDTNTGLIFIGKTGVLSNKTNELVRLNAGDEVIMSYDDATNALYAISDTAAQKINVGTLL